MVHSSKHRIVVVAALAVVAIIVCSAQRVLAAGDEAVSHSHSFLVDSIQVNPTPELVALAAKVDSANRAGLIERIRIEGSSSVDGPASHNLQLAERRADLLKEFFASHASLPDSLFSIRVIGEDWQGLRSKLPQYFSASEVAALDSIIRLTDNLDQREQLLRRYVRGRYWQRISEDILPSQRRASMSIDLFSRAVPLRIDTCIRYVVRPDTSFIRHIEPERKPSLPSPGHLYVKTNLPVWALLVASAAVELDVARHWSMQLPIYYSCLDHFTPRRKFHVLAAVPELRWWASGENQGFHIGAHAGFAYYNVAIGGTTRYQDRNGTTPAYGGGLNLGFRTPLGPSSRWSLELSAGAGAWKFDYDKYQNRDNGLRTGSGRTTYIGLDQAAISLCYRFDLTKGGGR